ncbi:hypothetical protein LZ30DRAFT_155229 [Colletotrichum cereale]|nr:hypothetical protein LZ30DRAFT_155229 [Colletotrichum cereale]
MLKIVNNQFQTPAASFPIKLRPPTTLPMCPSAFQSWVTVTVPPTDANIVAYFTSGTAVPNCSSALFWPVSGEREACRYPAPRCLGVAARRLATLSRSMVDIGQMPTIIILAQRQNGNVSEIYPNRNERLPCNLHPIPWGGAVPHRLSPRMPLNPLCFVSISLPNTLSLLSVGSGVMKRRRRAVLA